MKGKPSRLQRLRKRGRRVRRAVRRAPVAAVKRVLRIAPVRRVTGRVIAPQMALIAAKLVKEVQQQDPLVPTPPQIPGTLPLHLAREHELLVDVAQNGAEVNGAGTDAQVAGSAHTAPMSALSASGAPQNGLALLPSDRITVAINELSALERSLRPDELVIVGPWLGEVGFEVLYWIPHLTWVAATHKRLAKRMVVLSRGGVASWYSQIVPPERYIDLFDLIDAAEFQAWTEQRHEEGLGQKQLRVSKFERDLVEQARRRLGASGVKLLHPRRLYDAFNQLSRYDAIPQLRRISLYQPLRPIGLGPLAGRLPEEYIAARFYFNNSFPDTAENRRFIAALLRTLAEQNDIVLLNPNLKLDDHDDFEETGSGRIVRIDEAITASTNLEVQTRAIAGARAFVGTYGGLSYLAPHLGVASLSFYSDASRFNPQHLELAQRLFRGARWGQYVALDVREFDLIRGSFGSAPDGWPLGTLRQR